MAEPVYFIGIDVSQADLDVAVRPAGVSFRVRNDPAGLVALVERLGPLAPALVVLEATGGSELPALAALQAAGIAVAAVNPRQARDVAKGTGRLAKTDRGDAAALAHLAEAVRPAPRPAEPDARRALEALWTRRRQLVEMRVMETHRLAACVDAVVRAALERHVAGRDAELADAERRLAEAVQESPARQQRDELWQSIPGIGPTVSRTLLAALPELGAADRGALAAVAGLAPYARDSGPRRGPRSVRGGRPEVRRMLSLAAPSAVRHAGPLQQFAARLRGRGQRPKVVLTAVARKLLVIAGAVVRTGRPFDPALAATR